MRRVNELRKTPGLMLKRIIIVFIANVLGLYLISFGLDFTLGRLADAIVFTLFIAIINA